MHLSKLRNFFNAGKTTCLGETVLRSDIVNISKSEIDSFEK